MLAVKGVTTTDFKPDALYVFTLFRKLVILLLLITIMMRNCI